MAPNNSLLGCEHTSWSLQCISLHKRSKLHSTLVGACAVNICPGMHARQLNCTAPVPLHGHPAHYAAGQMVGSPTYDWPPCHTGTVTSLAAWHAHVHWRSMINLIANTVILDHSGQLAAMVCSRCGQDLCRLQVCRGDKCTHGIQSDTHMPNQVACISTQSNYMLSWPGALCDAFIPTCSVCDLGSRNAVHILSVPCRCARHWQMPELSRRMAKSACNSWRQVVCSLSETSTTCWSARTCMPCQPHPWRQWRWTRRS